jgi:RNA polymerase sigma factor (sigma-70 family)
VGAVPSIGRATRVERPAVHGADAAGELYERYSGLILGYCLRQLGSREEAEDALQTTFMNAFRGLQRGIVPEQESAWLFKIAHNVCLSRRRSSWRRGKVEAPNNFEVLQEVIPGREQVVADELIRLQDVLEDMPENQRRAILLREWQGLTYREISSELGLSQAATETLIFRARRALAQGLEQDADTWKRRLRRGADAGGAVACIQALFSGGGAAALKVGATVVAVAATAGGSAPAPAPAKHPPRAQAKRVVATTPRTSRKLAGTRLSVTFAAAPTFRHGAASWKKQSSRLTAETTGVPAESTPSPTQSTAALASPPAGQPAAAAIQPEPAPAPAPPTTDPTQAPVDPRHETGKGRGRRTKDKSDRQPQSATPQQTEPAPAETPSAASTEPTTLPETATPPADEQEQDHSDRQDLAEREDRQDGSAHRDRRGNADK